MTAPKGLHYTIEHEWVREKGELVEIGITDFAAAQLGDIVFVELPPAGDQVRQFEPVGAIESVKAVSDLYAPISGLVIEANAELADRPELLNSDPYGAGWIARIRPADRTELDALLHPDAYEALTKE